MAAADPGSSNNNPNMSPPAAAATAAATCNPTAPGTPMHPTTPAPAKASPTRAVLSAAAHLQILTRLRHQCPDTPRTGTATATATAPTRRRRQWQLRARSTSQYTPRRPTRNTQDRCRRPTTRRRTPQLGLGRAAMARRGCHSRGTRTPGRWLARCPPTRAGCSTSTASRAYSSCSRTSLFGRKVSVIDRGHSKVKIPGAILFINFLSRHFPSETPSYERRSVSSIAHRLPPLPSLSRGR